MALFSWYIVWCRRMMVLGSLRCRNNILRVIFPIKPVPHCIQHCSAIVRIALDCSVEVSVAFARVLNTETSCCGRFMEGTEKNTFATQMWPY